MRKWVVSEISVLGCPAYFGWSGINP